ncbi:hypothetical protein EDD22DRAFT_845942 [Suillus occidentalis]|nr:hypothetical protein EDD22DRAFT_845942 [Suillus occidentalis]
MWRLLLLQKSWLPSLLQVVHFFGCQRRLESGPHQAQLSLITPSSHKPRTKKNHKPASRKQKSTVPWPAAQLFESDSDDFKIDGSDGAASDIGAESDDNLEELDDDSILGLVGDKLKATLDYEWPQFTPHNDDSCSAASLFSSIPPSTTSPDSDNDSFNGIMDSTAEYKAERDQYDQ